MPLISLAQVNSKDTHLSAGVQDSILETSFVLKEHNVLFEKIYSSDLNKTDLINKLKYFLPGVKNFQLSNSANQNADQLSGRIRDFMVNYKKFGGSDSGPGNMLAFPLNANVIIQVKDKKYRLLITEIVFKGLQTNPSLAAVNAQFDDFITNNDRSKIKTSQRHLETAKFVNADLSISFDMQLNNKLSSSF